MIIFFNYKDGERCVDFSVVEDSIKQEDTGSSNEKKTNTHENECSSLIKSGDPSGTRTRDTLIKSFEWRLRSCLISMIGSMI